MGRLVHDVEMDLTVMIASLPLEIAIPLFNSSASQILRSILQRTLLSYILGYWCLKIITIYLNIHQRCILQFLDFLIIIKKKKIL